MSFLLIVVGILQFIGAMIFFSWQSQLSDEVEEMRLDLENIREWLKMPAKNGGN